MRRRAQTWERLGWTRRGREGWRWVLGESPTERWREGQEEYRRAVGVVGRFDREADVSCWWEKAAT